MIIRNYNTYYTQINNKLQNHLLDHRSKLRKTNNSKRNKLSQIIDDNNTQNHQLQSFNQKYIGHTNMYQKQKQKQKQKSKRQLLDQRLQRIKRNSQILMNKMDAKISSLKQVKQDLNQKSQRMTDWTYRFKQVITSMGQGIFYGKCYLSPPINDNNNVSQYRIQSVQVICQKIRQICAYGKQICILTGAGVSKSCGIPTFRGQNGLYNSKIKIINSNNESIEYEPDQFLTLKIFHEHPKQVWQWCEQLRQLVSDKKPGLQHRLIHQLCIKLRKLMIIRPSTASSTSTVASYKTATINSHIDTNITLITTNIDGLHTKAIQQYSTQQQYNNYGIYEIHGNLQYCVCQICMLKFKCDQYPPQNQKVCPKCQTDTKLRPYIMFFDQTYSNLFLPQQCPQLQYKKYDLIIVIGTSLSTGLSARLVQNSKIVIQINPKCVIQSGQLVYRMEGQAADVLQDIIKQLQSI